MAIITLIISILALSIATITYRYYMLLSIDMQLFELAKTCNSYLQEDYQVHRPTITEGRASGIVTTMENAILIIVESNYDSILIYKKDQSRFRKFFYRHLHSSIKVILKNAVINNAGFSFQNPDKNNIVQKTIQYQLEQIVSSLEPQIKGTILSENEREKKVTLWKVELS